MKISQYIEIASIPRLTPLPTYPPTRLLNKDSRKCVPEKAERRHVTVIQYVYRPWPQSKHIKDSTVNQMPLKAAESPV